MKLRTLTIRNYRSIRDRVFDLEDLNVFIGANASGKSTILDALRFVHEAVQPGGFEPAVGARGGIVHLAWKGEHFAPVGVRVELDAGEMNYAWPACGPPANRAHLERGVLTRSRSVTREGSVRVPLHHLRRPRRAVGAFRLRPLA